MKHEILALLLICVPIGFLACEAIEKASQSPPVAVGPEEVRSAVREELRLALEVYGLSPSATDQAAKAEIEKGLEAIEAAVAKIVDERIASGQTVEKAESDPFSLEEWLRLAAMGGVTYLLTNLRRDQKRAMRGEPTGSRPA